MSTRLMYVSILYPQFHCNILTPNTNTRGLNPIVLKSQKNTGRLCQSTKCLIRKGRRADRYEKQSPLCTLRLRLSAFLLRFLIIVINKVIVVCLLRLLRSLGFATPALR